MAIAAIVGLIVMASVFVSRSSDAVVPLIAADQVSHAIPPSNQEDPSYNGPLRDPKELVTSSDWVYGLDRRAVTYIPKDSRVHQQHEAPPPAFGYSSGGVGLECGDPYDSFFGKYGSWIEERVLLERAQYLQRTYAPEELYIGPRITESICETEGCAGKIYVGERLALLNDDGTVTEIAPAEADDSPAD
ncbi:MAG: hypothetical protein O3A96_06965 [Proteobacteria bacterium]|nr:hypothetical protein [Pseudomonadota bacterium]